MKNPFENPSGEPGDDNEDKNIEDKDRNSKEFLPPPTEEELLEMLEFVLNREDSEEEQVEHFKKGFFSELSGEHKENLITWFIEELGLERHVAEEYVTSYSFIVDELDNSIISKGYLNLSGRNIKTLPENLGKVNGFLDLQSTSIEKLPASLHVEGYLDIENTKNLKELPQHLEVEGDLKLKNTEIKHLPRELSVGGSISIDKFSLYEEAKKLKEAGSIEGDIDYEFHLVELDNIEDEDTKEKLIEYLKEEKGYSEDEINRLLKPLF